MRLVFALLVVLLSAPLASAAEWQRYSDAELGYSVLLPVEGFEIETDRARHGLTLYEEAGRGQIDVYGLTSEDGLSLAEIRQALSTADRIKEITYSRNGNSWFVVSGYYRRLADEATDLIFYAKFMISADGRAISAFEASYPVSDKERYDAIIERIEDSLTRPQP